MQTIMLSQVCQYIPHHQFTDWLQALRIKVNGKLANWDASRILITSLAVYVGGHQLYLYLSPNTGETFVAFYRRKAFQILLKLPYIGTKAEKEIDQVKHSIQKGLMQVYQNQTFVNELPIDPCSPDQVIEMIKSYSNLGHVQWQKGRVSGAVYVDLDVDHIENNKHLTLMKDVFALTAYTNPLHADVFPAIRKMESEIVAITLGLFKGNSKCVGSVTSGGTESLLLACKAYRDYSRYERNVRNPKILVPVTAHAGFDKAAQLLNITIEHVPVDQQTMQMDLKELRRRINTDVCLIVASAPGYPHGIFDPIKEVAELGHQHSIPVHLDSCLGGFLVPFAHESGFTDVPEVSFEIQGVTSISADTHKYGYAPKGTSVLMFSDAKYRHYQYFIVGKWPGGIYATSTVAGSRAGSSIATCWASLMSIGRHGYIQSTKSILTAARKIRFAFNQIPGIFVYGKPSLSVIAVGSNKFNIFLLSNALSAKGWSLNPIQRPAGFHVCLTKMHTSSTVTDQLIQDVKELSEQLLNDPNQKPSEGSQAAVYGLAESVPDISLLDTFARHYLDIYYRTSN